MMYRQLTQLLSAARLISRSQGASIQELENGLGVARRTVCRVITALEELGYPVYSDSVGGENRWKLNSALDRMRWWQPLPKAVFNFEDRVLLDYLFQKAAENPSLAKSAGDLHKKIALLLADGGYPIAEKEDGAGKALQKKPVMINVAPVGKSAADGQSGFIHDLLQSISQ